MRTHEQGKEGAREQGGSRYGRPVPTAPRADSARTARTSSPPLTSASREEPAKLLGLLMAALSDQGHYVVELPADEPRLHDLVERAGRHAGYLLGWRVRTARSRPLRRHGKKVVAVLVARTDSDVLQSLIRTAAHE